MKTRKYILQTIFLLFLSSSFLSCEHIFVDPDPENTPDNNFQSMWQVIHERYSYFHLKGIDWDSIHSEYAPRINPDMNERELFNVLSDMLFELNDGHVNLTSGFNRSRNWEWFLEHPDNYNQNIVEKNYLGRDYFITGPFQNQIIDSVLYIRYDSFADSFTDENLDELMERASGLKGVIVDVRSNGGGRMFNAQKLASCFATQTTVYAKERIKTGTEIDDFSSWSNLSISPRKGNQFTGKVIVLCNRRSYSATTFFAQMMKQLPNATLIGDQTGGGGGVPAFFELPNGWFYRFSVTQTINPLGEHIEPGVPVDKTVMLNYDDMKNGLDTIIETALEIIKN